MSWDRLSKPKLNLTCYFWAQGRCNKSDEDCSYQHAHTNRIALPPKLHKHQQSLLTKRPASVPSLENQHAHTDPVTPPAKPQRYEESYTKTPVSVPKFQNEEITCYNWHHNGRCNLSDGDCPYVHWHTGKVSLRPGNIPRPTTSEKWHPANVPSASPVVPRLSHDENLAIERCAQNFDQQSQESGEGKLQYNKIAELLLNNETVSTTTPARLGSHSAVDPGRSLPFQPNQQNYSTHFPRPLSPAPFSTSPNNQSIVRTSESAPMSRDKEGQAAPVHHLGPDRGRRREQLSSDERYRRTFRDDSRSRRHAPYEIGRARGARPVAMFQGGAVHARTAHRSPERVYPTSPYNENVEAERFLSQSVPQQSPIQPAFRQPTSASHRSPSTQQVFRRPPQQSSFDVMIDRMVSMLAQEDIRVTHAQVRETLRRGPSRQSSFDTMIDRMVEMLAEEDFHVTHAQVQDLVLRLQQPTISPASVTMEEDTAERLETRHLRRFR